MGSPSVEWRGILSEHEKAMDGARRRGGMSTVTGRQVMGLPKLEGAGVQSKRKPVPLVTSLG